MKKLAIAVVFLLMGLSSAFAQPGGEVTFGAFYSSLQPYGDWVSVDGGVYAWRPHTEDAGWRPYTMGRWVWTDDGWYWASDEPWAWAAYHYGRWYYDDNDGWLWIPGYDWAPAWVEWRYGGDYVGWAPLGPYALFRAGFGIHYARYWVTPYHYWSFVDCRHINAFDVHRYVYRSEENTRFIGRTRSAGSVRDGGGGRIITRGPERDYIERRGNVRIERAEINDVSDRGRIGITRTGDRERIDVYRPHVEQRDAAAERPERLRNAERPLGLDTRNTDIRVRDNDREAGRDINRATQYRQGNGPDVYRRPDVSRPVQPGTSVRPEVRTETDRRAIIRPPREDRRIDRQPDIRRSPSERQQFARPQTERPREQTRAPERSSGRTERGSRDEGRRR